MGGSTVFVSNNDIIVSFNIQSVLSLPLLLTILLLIPIPAAYNSFFIT